MFCHPGVFSSLCFLKSVNALAGDPVRTFTMPRLTDFPSKSSCALHSVLPPTPSVSSSLFGVDGVRTMALLAHSCLESKAFFFLWSFSHLLALIALDCNLVRRPDAFLFPDSLVLSVAQCIINIFIRLCISEGQHCTSGKHKARSDIASTELLIAVGGHGASQGQHGDL